jgi:hypothetical protein
MEEILETLTPEDKAIWMQHQMTKALLLQCEIDTEELKSTWARGGYTSEEDANRAQGQAQYAEGIMELVNQRLRQNV